TKVDNLRTERLDLTFLQKISDEWVGIRYRIDSATNGVGTLRRMEERLPLDTFDPYSDTLPNGDPQLGLINSSIRWAKLPDDSIDFRRVIDGVVQFSLTAYDTNGVAFAPNYAFTTN